MGGGTSTPDSVAAPAGGSDLNPAEPAFSPSSPLFPFLDAAAPRVSTTGHGWLLEVVEWGEDYWIALLYWWPWDAYLSSLFWRLLALVVATVSTILPSNPAFVSCSPLSF